MRRRNIFLLSSFFFLLDAIKEFSLVARPEKWFPEDHCDYRRALPNALRLGSYRGHRENGKTVKR